MATKTISITEEAYERLKSRKKENESFSDIINKITHKKSLFEIAGSLSGKESEGVEAFIIKMRKKSDEKINETVKSF